ncbi:MAG: phage tail tape measure protein, partial [Lachnospiraceae bacterium]|nr:phage tail tape measure protein [Lachnospiraceae bacterium]
LNALLVQLKSGDPSINLRKITEEIIRIENAEIAAGRAGKSLWDIFKTKSTYGFIGQMQSFLSMYVGFYGMINAARKAVEINREFDTTLTEMRKVSDETVQSLKSYQATTFDTADAVGTTAKQIQESTADYMRLGESLDEASESAKTANILLNVSEFDNIEDATKSLVSMGQAYKDLDKMTIVDKLNEVGEKIIAQTYSNVWHI